MAPAARGRQPLPHPLAPFPSSTPTPCPVAASCHEALCSLISTQAPPIVLRIPARFFPNKRDTTAIHRGERAGRQDATTAHQLAALEAAEYYDHGHLGNGAG